MKQPIIDAFGKTFYDDLVEWKPTNPVFSQLVETMVANSQLLSDQQPTAEDTERIREMQTSLEDPLKKQFIVLLFERERAHLEQLMMLERNSGGQVKQSDPLDRFLRYETTIKRDLYRAVDKYLELKAASAPASPK